MDLSRIEITDSQYLIKLNKGDFDISFINQLYKLIQAEGLFTPLENFDEDDIISRRVESERNSYFGSLDEK